MFTRVRWCSRAELAERAELEATAAGRRAAASVLPLFLQAAVPRASMGPRCACMRTNLPAAHMGCEVALTLRREDDCLGGWPEQC